MDSGTVVCISCVDFPPVCQVGDENGDTVLLDLGQAPWVICYRDQPCGGFGHCHHGVHGVHD